MPAHHGQTYDPDQEPAPRGGWFRMEERPFPARLDRAFRVGAVLVAVAIVAVGAAAILYAVTAAHRIDGIAPAVLLTLTAAALAYGFTRGIGLVALAVYGAARDGPELVVDWRALRHDLPLKRVQILLAEAALLLAAAGGSLWGFVLFVREGLIYGLAACVLIQVMTWWPYLRRWRLTGRAD